MAFDETSSIHLVFAPTGDHRNAPTQN